MGRVDLVALLRGELAELDTTLDARFHAGEDITSLLQERAAAVEGLLLKAWYACLGEPAGLALVAVGGFGRGVLHPHSDIDLLVLYEGQELSADLGGKVASFVSLLWDAGFYLGHAVRNPDQCAQEARSDVVTATSLMESRLLVGSETLFQKMLDRNTPEKTWPAREFFHAKYAEQRTRHQQFHETAYNLEPNIKEGPGGLRDIQMIAWVAQRHFGVPGLHGLVERGFLTEPEFSRLIAGQEFLWRVRYALHRQAGRSEDRLLFEHQRPIALQLGYVDDDGSNQAVERFMQDYYRTVTGLERLNERLLQLFEEELLGGEQRQEERLGEDFRLLNGYLDLVDPDLFVRRPLALLEMFLLLARYPDIRGVRASAIRQVVDHLYLIDDGYRSDPQMLACFHELLCQEQGVYTQLLRMNRYGVLAAFLPVFANIVGRMQFDLFHVYTVDQHILFVVRNLRRFAYGKYRDIFPHAPQVFREISRPQILYLAALFHDIAKGRSGDHSEEGAVDALAFCSQLPLRSGEAELIAWLVRYHLLMSQTAQKKDISDPDVIEAFARQVGSIERLQHLYLLTVADISATSPTLWNSWKSGLMWELYLGTVTVLQRPEEPPPGLEERIAEARRTAFEASLDAGLEAQPVEQLLASLPDSAYLRFNARQLEWAVRERVKAPRGATVVAIRDRRERAVSEVFVSSADYTGLFATTTAVLEELGINVLSARVVTTADGFSFDLFQVMDRQGRPLNPSDREAVIGRLESLLSARSVAAPVRRRMPRRLRPFVTAPGLQFSTGRGGSVTSMELECTDRPGLLSQLAAAMVSCEVRIHDAMIATLGDRVEDTFLVSDRQDRPLDEELRDRLHREILERLDERQGKK
jgi:[protein-PII] uridylyltransferase